MSWHISLIGKADALAKRAAEEFAKVKCEDPEAGIKNMVACAVAIALAAYPSDYVVRLDASGSQWCPDFGKAPHEKTNQLQVTLSPVVGFIE